MSNKTLHVIPSEFPGIANANTSNMKIDIKVQSAEYVKQGYNANQAKQLAWVDFWEYQGDSWISSSRRHHVYCKDCNKGNDFVAAGSAGDFIRRSHNGHKTTYFSK